MTNSKKTKDSLRGDIATLLRERWALVAMLTAFLLLLAVVVAWLLTRQPLATADSEPCQMRLLVESEKGGPEWLSVKPTDNEPAAVQFEEKTLIRRVEITGCS
jgi:hypothetical protein